MRHWIDTERARLFAEAEARDAAERAAEARHVAEVNDWSRGVWKHPPRPTSPLQRGGKRLLELANDAAPVVVLTAAGWLIAAIGLAMIGR